jgi:hypothetical protein
MKKNILVIVLALIMVVSLLNNYLQRREILALESQVADSNKRINELKILSEQSAAAAKQAMVEAEKQMVESQIRSLEAEKKKK